MENKRHAPHSKVVYVDLIPGVLLTYQEWCRVMETTRRGTSQPKYYRKKRKKSRYGKVFYVWQWRCNGKCYDLGRVKEGQDFWQMVSSKWGCSK